jgi:hypothetical protein
MQNCKKISMVIQISKYVLNFVQLCLCTQQLATSCYHHHHHHHQMLQKFSSRF